MYTRTIYLTHATSICKHYNSIQFCYSQIGSIVPQIWPTTGRPVPQAPSTDSDITITGVNFDTPAGSVIVTIQETSQIEAQNARTVQSAFAPHASHVCALQYPFNSIVCWGDNTYGQATVPAYFANGNATETATGPLNSCGISTGGGLL